MDHLADLIPKALRKKGIYDEVEAAQILNRAKEYYLGVAPKLSLRPFLFKNNRIYIEASSSAVANEAQYFKEGCVECLNQSGYDIREIIFRIQ